MTIIDEHRRDANKRRQPPDAPMVNIGIRLPTKLTDEQHRQTAIKQTFQWMLCAPMGVMPSSQRCPFTPPPLATEYGCCDALFFSFFPRWTSLQSNPNCKNSLGAPPLSSGTDAVLPEQKWKKNIIHTTKISCCAKNEKKWTKSGLSPSSSPFLVCQKKVFLLLGEVYQSIHPYLRPSTHQKPTSYPQKEKL